jgi:hypothetical protein
MLYKLFDGQTKPALMGSIVEASRVDCNPTGVSVVLIVLDEVHQVYRYKHFCAAVAAMRTTFPTIRWVVMGISSTPGLNKKSVVENA